MDKTISGLEGQLRTNPADASLRQSLAGNYRRAGRYDDANILMLEPACTEQLKKEPLPTERDDSYVDDRDGDLVLALRYAINDTIWYYMALTVDNDLTVGVLPSTPTQTMKDLELTRHIAVFVSTYLGIESREGESSLSDFIDYVWQTKKDWREFQQTADYFRENLVFPEE